VAVDDVDSDAVGAEVSVLAGGRGGFDGGGVGVGWGVVGAVGPLGVVEDAELVELAL
jgi:hypothetical protein